MDEAFGRDLERLANEALAASKRYWRAQGGRPESHAYHPAVAVTDVEVTITDGVGTVQVRFIDDQFRGAHFGARFRVPPYMEREGERRAIVVNIAEHVVTALGEATWAGGHPLSWPADDDGVRWFSDDVI